jgi:hypothetical protein
MSRSHECGKQTFSSTLGEHHFTICLAMRVGCLNPWFRKNAIEEYGVKVIESEKGGRRGCKNRVPSDAAFPTLFIFSDLLIYVAVMSCIEQATRNSIEFGVAALNLLRTLHPLVLSSPVLITNFSLHREPERMILSLAGETRMDITGLAKNSTDCMDPC